MVISGTASQTAFVFRMTATTVIFHQVSHVTSVLEHNHQYMINSPIHGQT